MNQHPVSDVFRGAGRAKGQRGAVLVLALIVLVVMLLAGAAMARRVGTGASIAGNLAFKQNATAIADLGIEDARRWLAANADAVNADNPEQGYFSSWPASVDPASYWEGTSPGVKTVTANDSGHAVSYVIHRLCEFANRAPTDPTQRCASEPGGEEGSTKGGIDYGNNQAGVPQGLPYYRITSRVQGPRNTVSYVQMVMY